MDPTSRFLNHVELLHRPGEYDLAVRFFETLGFEHEDFTEVFGATRRITGIFAGGGDRDPLNNVLYLSEFRQPDLQLDNLLRTIAKGNGSCRRLSTSTTSSAACPATSSTSVSSTPVPRRWPRRFTASSTSFLNSSRAGSVSFR